MIQVVKQGAECWQLTRVDKIWRDTHEYTVIGRVVRAGKLYYAEVADWADETFTYRRLPRGYLLAKAAYKAVIAASEKVLQ